MPRDRSRSPRRKERRRSRSRDKRVAGGDIAEKKLDKFGRDVSSRPTERYGSKGFREESFSRRREEFKDYRRQQTSPSSPPPSYMYANDNYPYKSVSEQENLIGCASNSYDEERKKVKEKFIAQESEVDDETRRMQQLMGISGFDTTKNKKVSDNVGGYAKINKTQKYRQYMNRRGGFNRPLDWVQ